MPPCARRTHVARRLLALQGDSTSTRAFATMCLLSFPPIPCAMLVGDGETANPFSGSAGGRTTRPHRAVALFMTIGGYGQNNRPPLSSADGRRGKAAGIRRRFAWGSARGLGLRPIFAAFRRASRSRSVRRGRRVRGRPRLSHAARGRGCLRPPPRGARRA